MGSREAPILETRNTQTMPGLEFPLDLTPIGIQKQIFNFNELKTTPLAEIPKALIKTHSIGANTITDASGKKLYEIGVKLGEPSAFGTLYKIKDAEDREYCCKIQDISFENPLEKQLGEAVIQHILYETTKHKNHYDCPYAPQLIHIYRLSETKLILIQELVKGNTLDKIVSDNLTAKGGFLTNKLIRIARKLQNLWRLYEFNHGDFHFGNVMFIGESPRLIDFGRSALAIGESGASVEILGRYRITRRAVDRDFTQLFAILDNYYPMRLVLENPIIEFAYIDTGIRRHLRRLAGSSSLHFGCYPYFNSGRTNPEANPDAILERFNAAAPLVGDDTCEMAAAAEVLGEAEIIGRDGARTFGAFLNAQTMNGILFAAVLAVGAYALGRARRGGGRLSKTRRKRKFRIKGGRGTLAVSRNRDEISKFVNRNIIKLNRLAAPATITKNQVMMLDIDIQDIIKGSAEYILDYIRFEVFPDLDSETMSMVLYNLTTIPLRNPAVAPRLLEVIKTKSFEKLKAFIAHFSNPDISAQLTRQKWPTGIKDMKTAIELYMSVPSSSTAIKVFRRYIYSEFPTREDHDAFVKWIQELDKSALQWVMHDYYPNAVCI